MLGRLAPSEQWEAEFLSLYQLSEVAETKSQKGYLLSIGVISPHKEVQVLESNFKAYLNLLSKIFLMCGHRKRAKR